MFHIIPPGTKVDFMSKTPFFIKLTAVAFIISIFVIFLPANKGGLAFGLDFSGGHEILVSFDKPQDVAAIRSTIEQLNLGEASVQSFEIRDNPRAHYLLRVQRSEALGEKEIASISDGFKSTFPNFKPPLKYDPDSGDVLEATFAATSTIAGTTTATTAMAAVVEQHGHKVRLVRKTGRADQQLYSVVLMGVDVSVVNALRGKVSPTALAERVEYVGPTVGKQLRNDGVLAAVYALLGIFIYVGVRFDFFYAIGAILCLIHDAVITIGILAIFGKEFSLATMAGILTLIGFSMNDTIVIFDRVRERVGTAQGTGLFESINKSINETLSRTLFTSFTVFTSCICLMVFGGKTVLFDFGLIMAIGVIIGCYSSIYIAAPVFSLLRNRFGGAPAPANQRKKTTDKPVRAV